MKIITINLSEPHVKALKMLQDLGLYPSRSEAIRVAIRDFLQKEFGFSTRDSHPEPLAVHARQASEMDSELMKKEISRLLRKLDEEASQQARSIATY